MQTTRALEHLQSHANAWLPVTSDDTLDALRELRKAGHDIKQRVVDGRREAFYTPPEPEKQLTITALVNQMDEEDRQAASELRARVKAAQEDRAGGVRFDVVAASEGRDAWSDTAACQHVNTKGTSSGLACVDCGEILVGSDQAMTPGMLGRTNALRRVVDADGKERWEVATQTCEQCGEQYIVRDEHVTKSPRHKQWAKGDLGPEFSTPKQQPTYKFPVDMPRSRIEFGLVITCPRCHGYRAPERRRISRAAKTFGEEIITPAQDECMDPTAKNERCHRCNGWGIIPNAGPVETDKEISHGS